MRELIGSMMIEREEKEQPEQKLDEIGFFKFAVTR